MAIHRHAPDQEEGGSPLPPDSTSGGLAATAKSSQPSTAMAAAMPSALVASRPKPPAPSPTPVAPAVEPAKTNAQTSKMNTPAQTNVLARLRQGNAAPMSSTLAADAVKKFLETVKTTLETRSSEYTINILQINAKESTTRLFASSIVFGVVLNAYPTKAMAYHVLLIGDTADSLSRVDQVPVSNNVIVEVPRVVGDAYDDEYRAQVQAQLRASFPDIETFLEAEASVLPAGYKYNDVALVQKTLFNILAACGTILNTTVKSAEEYEDLSIPALQQASGSRLDSVVTLKFHQPNTSDAVGHPVRSDIAISYSLVTGQQQGNRKQIQSLNSGQQQTEIFRIGGFMDLVWRENEAYLGVQANQFAAPFVGQQQNPNQFPWKYQARFVITDTTSSELATLPGQLWGLAGAMVLFKNNNWMGAFARGAGADADHHNIGAIGIEVNPGNDPSGYGKPFDETKSATFGTQGLYQMLTAFVRPEIVISMDVEECGPSTWQNSVFAAAPTNASANQSIIDAANLLTDGHFSKYFGTDNKPVIVNDENRIHLGYFTGANGQVTDLREIDHLTILNILGVSNPQMGRDWSDTFTQLNYDWTQRAHERMKLMKLISANITVTGYARRVTFTNFFLNCLAQAIQDCGMIIRAETPFMEITGAQRGQADFLRDATTGYGSNSNLFARGPAMGSTPNQGQGFQQGFGRWR